MAIERRRRVLPAALILPVLLLAAPPLAAQTGSAPRAQAPTPTTALTGCDFIAGTAAGADGLTLPVWERHLFGATQAQLAGLAEAAVAVCRADLSADPGNRRLLFNLGRALSFTPAVDEAVAVLADAAARDHLLAQAYRPFVQHLMRAPIDPDAYRREQQALIDAGNPFAAQYLVHALTLGIDSGPTDLPRARDVAEASLAAGTATATTRLLLSHLLRSEDAGPVDWERSYGVLWDIADPPDDALEISPDVYFFLADEALYGHIDDPDPVTAWEEAQTGAIVGASRADALLVEIYRSAAARDALAMSAVVAEELALRHLMALVARAPSDTLAGTLERHAPGLSQDDAARLWHVVATVLDRQTDRPRLLAAYLDWIDDGGPLGPADTARLIDAAEDALADNDRLVATTLLEIAAQAGNVAAMHRLYAVTRETSLMGFDMDRVQMAELTGRGRWLGVAAALGSWRAQIDLARSFSVSGDLDQFAAALGWLDRALATEGAERDEARRDASLLKGALLSGLVRDFPAAPARATAYLQEARRLGSAEAAAWLAVGQRSGRLAGDDAETERLLAEARASGDFEALFVLADAKLHRIDGFSADAATVEAALDALWAAATTPVQQARADDLARAAAPSPAVAAVAAAEPAATAPAGNDHPAPTLYRQAAEALAGRWESLLGHTQWFRLDLQTADIATGVFVTGELSLYSVQGGTLRRFPVTGIATAPRTAQAFALTLTDSEGRRFDLDVDTEISLYGDMVPPQGDGRRVEFRRGPRPMSYVFDDPD